MPPPPTPVLRYSPPHTGRGGVTRAWQWSAILLAAVPLGAVLSVHALYAVEWVVNGERPGPPHHGAGNVLEAALYNLSGILLMTFPFSLVTALMLPAVAGPNGGRRVPAVLFLPLAGWLASAIILGTDPFRAMYFWFD